MGQDRDGFTVVGLGEILWDLLPDGKQLGGAPANFAYHAQVLGARASVVSCIGEDDLGREILERLRDANLDTKHIAVDSGHPTGTVSVELDEQGKPAYVIHENVAWDFIPHDSSLELLAGEADAVCFGSLCQRSDVSRATLKKFVEATRPECVRICDINLRQSYYNRELIGDILRQSDVLKLNDEELSVAAHVLGIRQDGKRALDELQQRYALEMIVLTMGAEGSRLHTAKRVSSCKTEVPITIADTVGAGDAFTAAVCMGTLRGWDLDQTNRVANRLAAYVCTQRGAMPSISHDVLADLLADNDVFR